MRPPAEVQPEATVDKASGGATVVEELDSEVEAAERERKQEKERKRAEARPSARSARSARPSAGPKRRSGPPQIGDVLMS
jgi:hypothetical protein